MSKTFLGGAVCRVRIGLPGNERRANVKARSLYKEAVLSRGKPRYVATNFDTYRILQ